MTLETTKQSLEKWHDMIQSNDLSNLNDLLADEVVFRSPVAHKPYEGRQVVFFILTNVIQVFENFTYHREFYTEDGENVVLEFSANVGDKSLKGIDMIRFNEHGKIIDFEVMIRPMSGLAALAEQMGARITQFKPQ
ncbi:nuclear transport factor 2 family protein [Acinetobacter seifertii]|uniref:nuclear transport factor 2 family protein n=1 Tax=Acinetobacter seifertii TaxID=1530123 RepID=UPI001580FBD4|nr:nuclear transport factor 2 family protein [Acinetobacter seifertii]NUF52325.1 nuclear transport factor 2 family protein [Acinetobacter seifertii]